VHALPGDSLPLEHAPHRPPVLFSCRVEPV
jgi:hypothetical protein